MQFLLYVVLYPILWIISILPFPIFYALSDLVCFFTYRVFGYRKKTVRKNLAIALSHLPEAERLVIEKKFYSHMCDLFLEMVKTMTISTTEMDKRFVIQNLSFMKELEKKGKSIAIMTSHYASYEWSISINKKLSFESFAIYKKITNPYFDKLIRRIRSKFGATLINTKETIPTIESNFAKGHPSIYGFASDQSPRASRATHWDTFFGIETPIQTGAEVLSKKYDMIMVFMHIKKVKRGFYECRFELMSDDPKSVPDFELTTNFMRRVEAQILEAPEYYLWTHKRWKHKRKSN
ncbi:lysophospholipid acyltransferase family protein [Flavobacterium orientale]|uniref:Lipid A biosynthesis protein n=1 Tax=Flavobacterium orientale TaxID=1756020 RepID=A0A916Y1H0_9FLAO|nr:lysophospholipid acyltransferase family protein [Flavobacterium orientale]GGD26579.1 lipid A biosynthesis protein [Flavobacterium orientale]